MITGRGAEVDISRVEAPKARVIVRVALRRIGCVETVAVDCQNPPFLPRRLVVRAPDDEFEVLLRVRSVIDSWDCEHRTERARCGPYDGGLVLKPHMIVVARGR